MRQIDAEYARHIRESDAYVARTCRARSAKQGMLLLDPSMDSVSAPLISPLKVKGTEALGWVC
jgi:hypothetical protein